MPSYVLKRNLNRPVRRHKSPIGHRPAPLAASVLSTVLLLSGLSATAQNQIPPANPAPGTQPGAATAPAADTGLTLLPQGPPPTGLQAPLPTPIGARYNPLRPALTSPTLNEIAPNLVNRPVTINDAVAIALSINRSLALAEEALALAQGRTSETRAAFNPTLSANGTYTRLDQGSSANLGGRNVSLVNPDQPTLGLSFTLPLDIAGLLRIAQTQAQFQEVASRLDVNRSRNQLVSDVKNAFYTVLRNQALVSVATETLQDAVDRFNDANKKFIAGVVARFDVLRAQTDVANAQQQLITARSNVSDSIATLNDTIGIDVNTPLQVTDQEAVSNPPGVAPPPPDIAPTGAPGTAVPAPGNNPVKPADNIPASDIPPTPGTTPPDTTPTRPLVTYDSLNLGPEYEAVLKEALQTRPDVLEADANIAAARQGIQLARRSNLPTLGLSVGGVYSPLAAGFSPRTTTAQAVVTLAFPFYDGGTARAREQQARANVATAETNRRQALDTVTLDVRRAFLTLQRSQSNVAVANQALAQAREGYRLARVRYNAGVSSQAGISPLLEVSDAQAALSQAESNQVNALYDYNNARASLDRAIGRYSYQNNASGYGAPPSARTTGATGNRAAGQSKRR